ncbi:MAG: hypothetical protein NT116_00210 [Candidatus Parcubacteria bacterium]|nr:hypothetical protein [Candidatus Parcubacteria bacterium]
MNIVERIKVKLKCAYVYSQLKEFHTIIKLEFNKDEILTQEEEIELLRFIAEKIQPKRAYVICNRQYKEPNLPWSALLHLEEFKITDDFNELILQGFTAKR